ncbi:MAG: bifunctional folylpolyglutamate synthase/dihydrofolate synthase, partial [Acidobacteria bacterium]|nr:bifunctional folylpolyglutamate synthase/dihydrofolate synthase [Acidobacteriota bacterium]
MNLAESIGYLYSIGNEIESMKLGLETIRELCRDLGDPQESWPAVHIAGTNGKGSTAAMVESILRAAGIRTGLFISPHLVSITERIQVDGEAIPAEEFARLATVVREAGERLHRGGRLATVPTFFEQVTAIGYLWLAEQRVELAVLEVG